ncbi:MAG: OsmC-related (seleno)protein [Salinirussus sp.]
MLDWDLQDDLKQELRTIENASRVKTHANTVNTEILQNVYGRARTRGFSFEYDEPEHVVGGENRAPRPLEYFLAGWAFCQQVMYSRSALGTGTELENLEMTVTGDIDPRSALPESEVPAGFVDDEVRMVTRIESDADPDDVRTVVRRARKLCHAHASLQREMTLESKVELNGEPLDL